MNLLWLFIHWLSKVLIGKIKLFRSWSIIYRLFSISTSTNAQWIIRITLFKFIQIYYCRYLYIFIDINQRVCLIWRRCSRFRRFLIILLLNILIWYKRRRAETVTLLIWRTKSIILIVLYLNWLWLMMKQLS